MAGERTREEALAADPLLAIGARLCEFINTNFEPRVPLTVDSVTMRHIGELCWVLDVTPDYRLVPLPLSKEEDA